MNSSNKNLFVIFAPGLGGNHLANLLSLSEEFQTRFDINSYDSSAPAAHFSSVQNLTVDTILDNLDLLIDQNNVFCSHLGEYIWFADSAYISYFPKRQFVCLTMPTANTVAGNRLELQSPWIADAYAREEFSTLYSVKCLSRLFKENDWFEADADSLFNADINPLLDSLIKQGLQITVDRSTAQAVHTKWLTNILKV